MSWLFFATAWFLIEAFYLKRNSRYDIGKFYANFYGNFPLILRIPFRLFHNYVGLGEFEINSAEIWTFELDAQIDWIKSTTTTTTTKMTPVEKENTSLVNTYLGFCFLDFWIRN